MDLTKLKVGSLVWCGNALDSEPSEECCFIVLGIEDGIVHGMMSTELALREGYDAGDGVKITWRLEDGCEVDKSAWGIR